MAALQNTWLDKDTVMMESLTCFKSAGCNAVLAYFAKDAALILNE